MAIRNYAEGPETIVIQFPSWFDYVDDVTTRKTLIPPAQLASLDVSAATWAGTKDMKTAVSIAEKGWEQGAAAMQREGAATFEAVASLVLKPQVIYTEEPSIEVDAMRALAGEPDYWVAIHRDLKRGASSNIVRLVVNITASAGVPTEVIMAKGTMVAALAMLMEYAGVSVEIVSFLGAAERDEYRHPEKGRGKALEVYTTIKNAGEALNPLSIAFALAHPAALRRFGFACMEQIPNPDYLSAIGIPGCYGFACEASHPGDIYIPSAKAGFQEWADTGLARKWVIEIMKEQGLVLSS